MKAVRSSLLMCWALASLPASAIAQERDTAALESITTDVHKILTGRRDEFATLSEIELRAAATPVRFALGKLLDRTLHGGDISTYISLTGDRHPLASSTELARSLGAGRYIRADRTNVGSVVEVTATLFDAGNPSPLARSREVIPVVPLYDVTRLPAACWVIGVMAMRTSPAGHAAAAARFSQWRGPVGYPAG